MITKLELQQNKRQKRPTEKKTQKSYIMKYTKQKQ